MITIKKFHSPGNAEYGAACQLEDLFRKCHGDGVVIIKAQLVCYGKPGSEIDLVVLGEFRTETACTAVINDGEKLHVNSFCFCIEVKDHEASAIRFRGLTAEVNYNGQWQDVTLQSRNQMFALKEFLKGTRRWEPFICHFIWFRRLPRIDLEQHLHGVISPGKAGMFRDLHSQHNWLPADLDVDLLFHLACRQRTPTLNVESGYYTFSCAGKGEKVGEVREKVEGVLRFFDTYSSFEGKIVGSNSQLKGLGQAETNLETRLKEIEAERQRLAEQQELLGKQLEALVREQEQDRRDFTKQIEELLKEQRDLETQHQHMTQKRRELLIRQQQLAAEKNRLEKQIDKLIRKLQEAQRYSEQEGQTARQMERWVIGLSGIVAAAVLLFVTIPIIRTRSQPGIANQEEATTRYSPSSPPLAAALDATRPELGSPRTGSKPIEEAKAAPREEKKQAGGPATERQMSYLAVLVSQHRWSDAERDGEIVKVLGYVRYYSNLRKQEASKLIDAWKRPK